MCRSEELCSLEQLSPSLDRWTGYIQLSLKKKKKDQARHQKEQMVLLRVSFPEWDLIWAFTSNQPSYWNKVMASLSFHPCPNWNWPLWTAGFAPLVSRSLLKALETAHLQVTLLFYQCQDSFSLEKQRAGHRASKAGKNGYLSSPSLGACVWNQARDESWKVLQMCVHKYLWMQL